MVVEVVEEEARVAKIMERGLKAEGDQVLNLTWLITRHLCLPQANNQLADPKVKLIAMHQLQHLLQVKCLPSHNQWLIQWQILQLSHRPSKCLSRVISHIFTRRQQISSMTLILKRIEAWQPAVHT